MRLSLEHVPRRLDMPRAAVVCAGVWGAMVVVGYALASVTGSAATPCLFKNITGVPCAACGGTRATASLVRADVLGALALNPLVVVLGVVFGGWALARFGFGRQLRVELGNHERVAAWTLATTLFAANWAYVISACH